MDRVVLHTDFDGFQKDVAKYGEKTQIQQDIKSEMKKLLPKYKVTNDFFKDIDLSFYNAIEKAYPEHIKLMKAQKVPEMIDMDVSKLMQLSSQYEDMKHIKNVSISAYEVCATTEKEINDYRACIDLIKSLKEFQKKTNQNVNAVLITRAVNGYLGGVTSMTQTADDLVYNYAKTAESRMYDKRIRK